MGYRTLPLLLKWNGYVRTRIFFLKFRRMLKMLRWLVLLVGRTVEILMSVLLRQLTAFRPLVLIGQVFHRP